MTDYTRITGMFDLRKLSSNAVVIGCGALGSAVALQLAKLGIPLELWDDDVVEAHNIPNQLLFGPEDIGKGKAVALADAITRLTGSNIRPIPNKWEPARVYRSMSEKPYVFACVDTMRARNDILRSLSHTHGSVLVDGRIGARDWSTFLVDRSDLTSLRTYAETIVPDDETFVERGACGNILSIGATASLAASYMVWQFMDHIMGRQTVPRIDGSVNPFYLAAYTKEKTDGEQK